MALWNASLLHSMRDCFCTAYHFIIRAWQVVDTNYLLNERMNSCPSLNSIPFKKIFLTSPATVINPYPEFEAFVVYHSFIP